VGPVDLGAHERGVRMEARHMCPECGAKALLWCSWCQMAGSVSEEQLARWLAHQQLVNR
jgi:hypothetical protein